MGSYISYEPKKSAEKKTTTPGKYKQTRNPGVIIKTIKVSRVVCVPGEGVWLIPDALNDAAKVEFVTPENLASHEYEAFEYLTEGTKHPVILQLVSGRKNVIYYCETGKTHDYENLSSVKKIRFDAMVNMLAPGDVDLSKSVVGNSHH